MQHFNIKVGIKTDGNPIFKIKGDYTEVGNMLIGDGFHWQKNISTVLPGSVYKMGEKLKNSACEKCGEHVTLINELPLETYLECVVGSEMSPKAPLEFLKAHAVISRSWAFGKINISHVFEDSGKINSTTQLIGWDDNSSHKSFDVCSDDHCQRYQGIQELSHTALKSIRETAGLILVDDQKRLIDTRFSKCCGGRTEIFSTCWQNTKANCLESVNDPWCDLSNLSEKEKDNIIRLILKDYDLGTQGYGYSWETTVSKDKIEENLRKKFGRDIGKIISLQPLHRGPSGRIDLIKLTGSKGKLELGKELWIRRLLSDSHLYSSNFEIIDEGINFHIQGRGWGHGVGLCQIGAANMAMQGYSFNEILDFYYPGSKLLTI